MGSETEYLLKFFAVANLPNDQDSEEIKAFVAKENEDLFDCLQAIIELTFSDLYSSKDSSDNKNLFYCFLVIFGKLFENRSADLLSGLKRAKFYVDMVQELLHRRCTFNNSAQILSHQVTDYDQQDQQDTSRLHQRQRAAKRKWLRC